MLHQSVLDYSIQYKCAWAIHVGHRHGLSIIDKHRANDNLLTPRISCGISPFRCAVLFEFDRQVQQHGRHYIATSFDVRSGNFGLPSIDFSSM